MSSSSPSSLSKQTSHHHHHHHRHHYHHHHHHHHDHIIIATISSSFAEGSMQGRRKLYHRRLRVAQQGHNDRDQSDQPCILGVERQQQPVLYYLTVDDRLRQDITDSSGFFFSKCIGEVVRLIRTLGL
jgi:hypothetical protein